MAIRPEWKSRPDIVLYSWAGAIGDAFSSGTSWTPSMKVEDLLRYLGEFAAISAVLGSTKSASKLSASSGRRARATASIAWVLEDMTDVEE
jgi:hypothetical protein